MHDSTSSGESNETEAAPVLAYHSSSVASTSAVVWCRILAIFMLGWGLQSALIGVVAVIDYGQRSAINARFVAAMFLYPLVPGAVWLLLAWYCWAKAPSLADRMTRGSAENAAPSSMSADELLLTLIIGIGIYMLATGFSDFAQLIYIFLERKQFVGQTNTVGVGIIVGSFARWVLGFWFILGPRGIVDIVRRYGGRPTRDSTELVEV
jgi:hypothetical protein